MSKLVYQITVDGTPRYVGAGTRKRMLSHMQQARAFAAGKGWALTAPQATLYRKLAAVLDRAKVEIVRDDLTDDEAFTLERQLITTTPGLWNIAPGGSGLTSELATEINSRPSVRAKHRHNSLAMWARPGFREKMRAARLGKMSTPKSAEARAKMSASAKARISHLTTEQRLAVSIRMNAARAAKMEARA